MAHGLRVHSTAQIILPLTNLQRNAIRVRTVFMRSAVTIRTPSQAPARTRAYIPQLDGVRGLAILMVLAYHFGGELPKGTHKLIMIPFAAGWMGVDLFFVLSGFLITGILLNTRRSSNYFRSFYFRRFVRIFPVFYGSLVVLFIIIPHVDARLASLLPPQRIRWCYWLYVNNWTPDAYLVGHFWSLAIEEQFYIVWPLLVWTLSDKALFRFAIAGITVSLTLRCALTFTGADREMIYRNTVCRMDALLMGAVCAMWHYNGYKTLRLGTWLLTPLLPAAIVLLLSKGQHASPWMTSAGFSFIALAASGTLLYCLATPLRILSSLLLTRIGRWSYGAYVYHIPIYHFLNSKGFLGRGWISIIMLVFINIIFAAFSFEFFEKHVLSLKDRFKPRFTT